MRYSYPLQGDTHVHQTPFAAAIELIEVFICLFALAAILLRKQWTSFWTLGAMLGVRLLSGAMMVGLMHIPHSMISRNVAYDTYFYVYWSSFVLEAALGLVVVYSIFRLAMAPLKGLQNLGMMIFRWAAAISVAVALCLAFTPHMTRKQFLFDAIVEMQRMESVLTLCLLLFVCFAIRPMGLTYSSRIFGVALGLGFISTNTLVQAAFATNSLNKQVGAVGGVVVCVALALWTAYFALPEPKRRLIVLPTTSPFLRWNQISLALGDNPGYVAVGGVPPEMFAPAELEVMRRASLKMVQSSAKNAPIMIRSRSSVGA
jgi:hypothetical protein